MVARGFFSKKGTSTDLIARIGQTTNALPSGTQESAIFNQFRDEGRDGYSFRVPVFPLVGLNQPRDAVGDKRSYQINQPFGFIGVNQPRTFDISGGGGTVTYYKMRGYYVTGAVYETYVVSGSPSSTPPSGHVLIDVAIVATWQV